MKNTQNFYTRALLFMFYGGGIIFLLNLYSCQKDQLLSSTNEGITKSKKVFGGIPDCNVTIEQGILHFKSMEDYQKCISFIEKTNPYKIRQIEKQNGFTSYDSKVNEILNEYARLNEMDGSTREELLAFREANKNYVIITDNDFDLAISGAENSLISPEGFLILGDEIMKFEKNQVKSTSIDNKTKFIQNQLPDDQMQIAKVNEIKRANRQIQQVNKYGNTSANREYRCGGNYDNKKTTLRVKWCDVTNNNGAGWGGLIRLSYRTWFEIEVKNYSKNYRYSWWYASPRKTIVSGTGDAWFKYYSDKNLPQNFYHTYNDIWTSSSYIKKNYNEFYFEDYFPEPLGWGTMNNWRDYIRDNSWMYVYGTVQLENCPGNYVYMGY